MRTCVVEHCKSMDIEHLLLLVTGRYYRRVTQSANVMEL